MGGGDKTLLFLAGRSLLSLVLERLRPQAGKLAISANGDASRFREYGLPVLPDDGPAGQAGPLAGVLAGLDWAAGETDSDHLLTVAGDTPFFPPDLASRLAGSAAHRHDGISVASSAGRLHPVFAVWPLAVRTELRAHLARKESFRVTDFLALQGHRTVEFDAVLLGTNSVDPFLNVNTPADLARAEALAVAAQR